MPLSHKKTPLKQIFKTLNPFFHIMQFKLNSLIVEVKKGSIIVVNPKTIIKKLTLKTKKKGFNLIILPLEFVFSIKTLKIALEQAINAFKKGSNKAKTLELEFLRRFFAQKQLNKVIKLIELKKGKNNVVLIFFGKKIELKEVLKELSFKEKNSIKPDFKKIMKAYNISENELKAFKGSKKSIIEKIVIERIALMNLGD
jgi:tRNA threonylcarbamoyladenosine modification (KEOPS) complex Cgi121 subunit